MNFSNFTMLIAIVITTVAAWFSIDGLTAMFPGAFLPIIVMGAVMEVGKVTTLTWLKMYWQDTGVMLKSALCILTFGLAVLTSYGTFGFLSKNHTAKNSESQESTAQIQALATELAKFNGVITDSKRDLANLDAQVNAYISAVSVAKGNTATYAAENANNLRKKQEAKRKELATTIAAAQVEVDKLNAEKLTVEKRERAINQEVSALKNIASVFYTNPTQQQIDNVANMFISLLTMLLDPLAIVLVIAANHSRKIEAGRNITVVQAAPQIEKVVPVVEPKTDVEVPMLKFNVPEPHDVEIVTIGQTKQIVRDDVTHLQHNGKRTAVAIVKQECPEMFLTSAEAAQPVQTFGVEFPKKAAVGEYFVRVDVHPHRAYKFDGVEWVQLGKNASKHVSKEYAEFVTALVVENDYNVEWISANEHAAIAKWQTE